jgi:nitrogen-specific signal transduction histidine kinase
MVAKQFKVFTEADASVLMLNDGKGNLNTAYSIGIPISEIKDATLPLSKRLKDIIARPVIDARYTSFLNTPLIRNRKLIGLSAVFSTVPEIFHPFEHGKYESLFLTMLAGYAAINIENASLDEAVRSMEYSQANWKNIFNSIDDLISVHDRDYNIILANKSVAREFNKNEKEIIGKKCYEIYYGSDECSAICPCRRVSETKTKCAANITYPKKQGVFNITTFPFFDETGNCIGTIRVTKNVSEFKGLQNQTVLTEKVSSLGAVIGWILHEYDNSCTAIHGNKPAGANESVKRYRSVLNGILKKSGCASGIIKHVVDLMEHEGIAKINIDIHQIIDEAISWFSDRLKVHDIQIDREYHKLPIIICCYKKQMLQVFINLISNALDAMEDQGDNERILSVKTEKYGTLAKIYVKDTGCGIPMENKDKIFEPFFTTKKSGIGLGLPLCQKIVLEHGGTIHVSSQTGKATTMTVELPLAKHKN